MVTGLCDFDVLVGSAGLWPQRDPTRSSSWAAEELLPSRNLNPRAATLQPPRGHASAQLSSWERLPALPHPWLPDPAALFTGFISRLRSSTIKAACEGAGAAGSSASSLLPWRRRMSRNKCWKIKILQ